MKMKTEKEMEIECALFSAWLRISLLSQFHPAPGLDLGLFMYDRRQASLTSIYARPISVNGYNKCIIVIPKILKICPISS
jgi:hypothetical protein